MIRRFWWVMLLPLLPACIDEIPDGTLLERPRVLGARIQIEGEPERASPRPGEDATLEVFTASNDGATWTGALTACVEAPSFMGIPGCAGMPFAFSAPGAPTESPELALSLPDASAFAGGSSSILIAGVLCSGGTPSTETDESMLPVCEPAEATREVITFSVPVALGMQPPNQHPTLADETFFIDDMEWAPPDAPPASGCASATGPALPRVPWTDEENPSVLRFTSDPADREEYQELVLGETPMFIDSREDLQVTHLASAGDFQRLETEVFSDDAPDPSVEWAHPPQEDIPAEGLTVRFFFIVRDGRAGMDWTERALCLVP